jgi:hypothetical protein
MKIYGTENRVGYDRIAESRIFDVFINQDLWFASLEDRKVKFRLVVFSELKKDGFRYVLSRQMFPPEDRPYQDTEYEVIGSSIEEIMPSFDSQCKKIR